MNVEEDPIWSRRVMSPLVLMAASSESSHSKVTFPTDDTVQSATVTVQVRVSVSPAMVVLGELMEAERAGTVDDSGNVNTCS